MKYFLVLFMVVTIVLLGVGSLLANDDTEPPPPLDDGEIVTVVTSLGIETYLVSSLGHKMYFITPLVNVINAWAPARDWAPGVHPNHEINWARLLLQN